MMLRRFTIACVCTCSFAASIAIPPPVFAAVGTADEVCPPSADPCIITQPVVIADGATLDFGTRAVRIEAGGQLDIGAGTATVRCGSFSSETGTAIGLKMRAPTAAGETVGGNLTVEAMRTCAADPDNLCTRDVDCDFGACAASVCELDRERACADDAGCELGTCSVTACTGDMDRACTDDSGCNVGPCDLTIRRCTNDQGQVCFNDSHCDFGTCAVGDLRCSSDVETSCASDADCQKGACNVDVCTRLDAGTHRECGVDADCTPGPCIGGDGAIRLSGRTRADGTRPGRLTLRAAGDVEIAESIQLQTTSRSYDGGRLRIDSFGGAVRLAAPIDASGVNDSWGGEILAIARTDVIVDAPINLSGGHVGGLLELYADRDVLLSDAVAASSEFADGDGGDVVADAGRDVLIADDARIITNGHSSVDNTGGYGGIQDYIATGNLIVAPGATLEAHGAAPNGYGGDIYFDSEGNTTIAGNVSTKAVGSDTGGGYVDIQAYGLVSMAKTSVISVVAGAQGYGVVRIYGGADVRLDGLIDARMTNDGRPSDVEFEAGGDLILGGDVLVSGVPEPYYSGDLDIEACRIELERGASVANAAAGASNTLIVHDRIEVGAGASLVADAAGSNVFVYRDAGVAPTVAGLVTPAYQGIVRPTLESCPVCGNSVLERGESCDDGDEVDGDGCSADCQDEGCIAATPGYPTIPLCSDGNPCTADRCDPETHACTNVFACDDGNTCTVDTCDPIDGCLNVAEPLPESLCLTAARSSLRLKNPVDPAKADLAWRWGKGGAFDHAALGAPDANTTYALCVYDMTAASPALAASIDVAPSALWEATPPRGWEYADTRAESDGVRKLRLTAGTDRQTKASVGARGAHLPLAPAISSAEYFDVDPRVIAQLISSDGMCLTSEFAVSHVQRNDAARFKAKAR